MARGIGKRHIIPNYLILTIVMTSMFAGCILQDKGDDTGLECEEISDQILSDECFLAKAQADGVAATCKRVISRTYRDICIEHVAVKNQDISLCDLLMDQMTHKRCISSLSVAPPRDSNPKKTSTTTTFQESEIETESPPLNITIKPNDPCSALTASARTNCLAIRNTVPHLCTNCGTDFFIGWYEDYRSCCFKVMQAVNSTECRSMPTQSWRNRCYWFNAILTGEPDLCMRSIGKPSEGSAHDCLSLYAFYKNDPRICALISKTNLMGDKCTNPACLDTRDIGSEISACEVRVQIRADAKNRCISGNATDIDCISCHRSFFDDETSINACLDAVGFNLL